MKAKAIKKVKWSPILQSNINKWYNSAIATLTEEERESYDDVKAALLRVDSEDNLLAPQKFYAAHKLQGETFAKFCQRLTKYFQHMTRDLPSTKDANSICQCAVLKRFITSLSYDCQTSVHDRKPTTINQACAFAEEYFALHRWSINNYLGHGKWANTNGSHFRRSGSDQGYLRYQQQRGHKDSTQSNQQKDKQDDKEQKKEDQSNIYKPPHKRPSKTECFKCHKLGHIAKHCRSVQYIETSGSAVRGERVVSKGTIAGKQVTNIMLDTGAEMSVVA